MGLHVAVVIRSGLQHSPFICVYCISVYCLFDLHDTLHCVPLRYPFSDYGWAFLCSDFGVFTTYVLVCLMQMLLIMKYIT
jgi:hypothetical protein